MLCCPIEDLPSTGPAGLRAAASWWPWADGPQPPPLQSGGGPHHRGEALAACTLYTEGQHLSPSAPGSRGGDVSVFATIPLYVIFFGEKVKNFISELYRQWKSLRAD